MTGQPAELLARYRRALEEQARADVQVKLLKMEARLLYASCPMGFDQPSEGSKKQRKLNRIESYIAEHWEDADDNDWAEWLRTHQDSVSVAETARFLGLDFTQYRVRALLNEGVLKHGAKSKGTGFRIDPISVVDVIRLGEEYIRQCQSQSDQSEESGP